MICKTYKCDTCNTSFFVEVKKIVIQCPCCNGKNIKVVNARGELEDNPKSFDEEVLRAVNNKDRS